MPKNFNVKIIIFLILFFITVSIYALSSHYIDNRVNDFFTKIFTYIGNKNSDDNVVLVVIDNKSVAQIAWPWQRDLFSDLFSFLENQAGAKSVVFNNLILNPDTYHPQSDKIFNENLKNNHKLINSFILLNSGVSGDVLPDEYIDIFNSKNNVQIIDKRKKNYPSTYRAVVNLPKDFLNNVQNLASYVIPEDNDEIVREYMPVVQLSGNLYPSLALSAYSMYTGENNFFIDDNYLCSADDCKTLKIPLYYKYGRDYLANNVFGIFSVINWYKPTGTYYSHKTYSAIDVLLSQYAIKMGIPPKINPDVFKDKIVIVGLNADRNVWDRLSETPVIKRQADIDVHATVIDNMLNNSFYSNGNQIPIIIITLIFCIFIIRGFKNTRNNLIYTSLFVFIYFLYYVYCFFIKVHIPLVSPIFVMYMSAFSKDIYSIVTADSYSEMIKQAMGKYVSKDVMNKVVSNLEELNVGGVRKTVSVLFVDIRNFTQISESLPPHEVSSILNDYFSVVEPIIAQNHGIVNKYMGDGILAVFSEPANVQVQAVNSIICAMQIIYSVKILREKLLLEGKPKIEIGIGINTGDVFAGNIGTEDRLEYTVIGDNVNLAYRIEAYNQILKTQFLISEYTYEYVKDFVEVVKLSQIKIKGKSFPIDIYEVLSIKDNG